MRRPTFCSNSVAVEPPRPSEKEESRMTRVKRVFSQSLRKPVVNKVFAVNIDDLPVNKEHVPKVYSKMASYIEAYGLQVKGLFRLSGGNPSLVEQLKASFNRTGDADLEACSDVTSVATLLKLWLRDLPEPLVSPAVTAELVSLHQNYGEHSEWCVQARHALEDVPLKPAATLQRTLALLHEYSVRNPLSAAVLPSVFAPLLLCAEYHGIANSETIQLTAQLILDYNTIYRDKVVQARLKELKQRKRKERHNSDATSLDRKFVRSNSEERPCEEEKNNQKENIRRVSSHQDLTSILIALEQHNQPLQEHNHYDVAARCTPKKSGPSPSYVSEHYEENEYERRRRSERHARHLSPPRRRRQSSDDLVCNFIELIERAKASKSAKSSSKKKERAQSPVQSYTPPLDSPVLHQQGDPTEPLTSCNFRHPQKKEMAQSPVQSYTPPLDSPVLHQQGDPTEPLTSCNFRHPQKKERAQSPVQSYTSPLDSPVLHQQGDPTEPLASRNFRHPQGGDRLVSPRNSIVMTHRVFFAPEGTTFRNEEAEKEAEKHISQVKKQMHRLRRKLKLYEEGFEKEFGYRPSLADKMSNPDITKITFMLTKLKKDIKHLKEEGTTVLDKNTDLNNDISCDIQPNKEAVLNIDKKLSGKRMVSGRPARLEEMTRDQLVEEKLAMQKGLLYFENMFGRPNGKEDRDTVRPLYDRYRSLKRLLATNAPSKLTGNVAELSTILEHETMDFTSPCPPPPTTPPSPPRPQTSTSDMENLHSLPMSELAMQLHITREEKKRLRRSLHEFEDECQKKFARKLSTEDKLPGEQIYSELKHVKARLRLLEALLMKKK